MKYLIICAVLLATIGCTDSLRADIGSYGKRHRVTMYNGGTLVRQWVSTGKVTSMSESDGWQFRCSETKKLVRVGGDVIIEVID